MHEGSAPGISWFGGAVRNSEEIIRRFSEYEWSRPQGVKRDDRSNSVIYFRDRKPAPWLFEVVDELANSFLYEYRNEYFIPNLSYDSIEALRYESGEHYVGHYDNGSKHVAGRICSLVAYLNDDYEGGEIEFSRFGIVQKPSAGSLVIFPSNYPYFHVVRKVTKGTRYALNVFFHYE